jgi:hypothetical protein
MRNCFIASKNLLLVLLIGLQLAGSTQPVSPESFFGFNPGADKMLFKYEQMMDYLMLLDDQSSMIRIDEVGKSSFGKPMYVVCISSEANIARLDRLKEINRKLALNADLSAEERRRLVEEGRVFVYMTLSMHSTEVAPSQAAPLIAWELLTTTDRVTRNMLDEVVYMFVPSHNPDGMNMIVDHYNKTKDTPLDGSSMPGVYHKYVGHNINRDFVWLTQAENKVVSHLFTSDWFPQVMIEKHQMGSSGPRYFVSPPHDPIAENVDAAIWNWHRVFGSRALTDMTASGLQGVSVNYLFDDYWPGATTTSIWKGVIGMLSEAAGVNIASPIYVERNELRTRGKGLGSYDKSINMPEPWPGGWWRLSDIVEYEKANTMSYLRTSAIHRKEILEFRNEYTKNEVAKGSKEPPYFYLMPLQQHDQSELVALVNLLGEHNINTYQLTEDVLIENRLWKAGDIAIPLAQPYRSFIKEIMEVQIFPERFYTTGGEMIRPYDVTSWSLPLHKGVEAVEISKPVAGLNNKMTRIESPFAIRTNSTEDFAYMLFTVNHNESFKAAFHALAEGLQVMRTTAPFSHNGEEFPTGSFVVKKGKGSDLLADSLTVSPVFLPEEVTLPETTELETPRIAIVESWFHAMDAGWLRFIFDDYAIPFTVLRPADLKNAKLNNYDVVILTDEGKSTLLNGKRGSGSNLSLTRYPPDYAKGMEKKGLSNLLQFVTDGGTVLSWGGSTELFTGVLTVGEGETAEEFQLPVRNIAPDLNKQGLSVPGALLRLQLTSGNPLTPGLPENVGIFYRGNEVFRTSIPYFDMDRRVVGAFPERDILISGYADKNELLARQAGLVWVKKGKGQIVLYGFSPHFRGQMQGTYKLLLNGLLLEKP